jgi:hypothetical protein
MSFVKGNLVTIRPKWRDGPEDNHVYRVDEWNGDRGFIVPIDLHGFKILPRSLVRSEMIECTMQVNFVKPVAIKSLEVLPPEAVVVGKITPKRSIPKLLATHHLKLAESVPIRPAVGVAKLPLSMRPGLVPGLPYYPTHAASSDALSDPCNKCGLWIKFWVNIRLIERPPQSEVYFFDGCYYHVLTSEELDWENYWFISDNMVVFTVAKVTDENHIMLIDAAVKNDPHAWERGSCYEKRFY